MSQPVCLGQLSLEIHYQMTVQRYGLLASFDVAFLNIWPLRSLRELTGLCGHGVCAVMEEPGMCGHSFIGQTQSYCPSELQGRLVNIRKLCGQEQQMESVSIQPISATDLLSGCEIFMSHFHFLMKKDYHFPRELTKKSFSH